MLSLESQKSDRTALVAELKLAGTTFAGNSCRCPWHDDKSPSAGIYQNDKGYWRFKCQKCGFNFSVIDVRAQRQGKKPAEIISEIVSKSGVKPRRSKPSVQSRVYSDLDSLVAACPDGEKTVFEYCHPNGKIDSLVIRSDGFNADGDRIKPTRQARPCDGGYEMKAPPKPWLLYNLPEVAKAGTVVIVEGEKCVEALRKYGITATTSRAGAGNFDKSIWMPLSSKNTIIWPDNDDNGRNYADGIIQLLEKLPEPPVSIAILEPTDLDLEEKEDAADFIEQLEIVNSGRTSNKYDISAELHKALNKAKSRVQEDIFLQRLTDIQSGQFRPLPLPFSGLHAICRIGKPGTITIIYGEPGSTKSFLLFQLIHYWLDNGIKVCSHEFEGDKECYLYRTLAQISGIPQITDEEWISEEAGNAELVKQQYQHFKNKIDRILKSLWAIPESQMTYDQMCEWSELRAKEGYRVICLDPISAAKRSARTYEADSNFIHRVKSIANKYNCAFILINHTTKNSKNNPAVMAGGEDLKRFADTVLKVESHDDDKQSTISTGLGPSLVDHNRSICIEKNRHGKGRFKLAFNFEALVLNELGIIRPQEKKK